MNIKFRSIEFFGVSGSGKSYLRGFIKKKLEEEGFQIFDTREIIVNFIDKLIPLNFSQKCMFLNFKESEMFFEMCKSTVKFFETQ